MCLLHGGGAYLTLSVNRTQNILWIRRTAGPHAHRLAAVAPGSHTNITTTLHQADIWGTQPESTQTPMWFSKMLFHILRLRASEQQGCWRNLQYRQSQSSSIKVPYNAQFTLWLLILPAPLSRQFSLNYVRRSQRTWVLTEFMINRLQCIVLNEKNKHAQRLQLNVKGN